MKKFTYTLDRPVYYHLNKKAWKAIARGKQSVAHLSRRWFLFIKIWTWPGSHKLFTDRAQALGLASNAKANTEQILASKRRTSYPLGEARIVQACRPNTDSFNLEHRRIDSTFKAQRNQIRYADLRTVA